MKNNKPTIKYLSELVPGDLFSWGSNVRNKFEIQNYYINLVTKKGEFVCVYTSEEKTNWYIGSILYQDKHKQVFVF